VLQPSVLAGSPPLAEVDTLRNAGITLPAVSLTGTISPPAGRSSPLVFASAGPARYTAALPDAGPGVYRITVRQPGSSRDPVNAAVAVPYPAEYLPSPVGPGMLGQLAALTGGRGQDGAGQDADWERAHIGRHAAALWWPLVLISLVLFLAGILIRLVSPSGAPAGSAATGEGEHDKPGTHRAQPVDR
jgi:hypothetical protein